MDGRFDDDLQLGNDLFGLYCICGIGWGQPVFFCVQTGNVYPVYGGHVLAAFPVEDELLAADYSVLFCRFRFAVVAGIVCRP